MIFARDRKLAVRIAVAILAAAVVAGLLIAFGSGTPRAAVPDVIGEPTARALQRVRRHDLVAEVVRDRRASRVLPARLAGRVVHQNYPGGVTIPRGSTVRLTVAPRRSGR